jgi:phosphoribosylglycinamide formyltransferase-1
VGVLISGRGSNLGALIEAARATDYPAEIALVISNRPGAKGLAIARKEGIATAVIDHARFASRQSFEEALQSELMTAAVEIVCLAGFMRVLSADFAERWRGRLLNIHPSLLPAFKGLDTHARALAAGVKIHGCSVHFVVPEVDSGPIVMQAAVPVFDDDDEERLAARVLAEEHRIYPAALRLLAEDRIRIAGDRVLVADKKAATAASAASLRSPAV